MATDRAPMCTFSGIWAFVLHSGEDAKAQRRPIRMVIAKMIRVGLSNFH
jgi:hypothetical protein